MNLLKAKELFSKFQNPIVTICLMCFAIVGLSISVASITYQRNELQNKFNKNSFDHFVLGDKTFIIMRKDSIPYNEKIIGIRYIPVNAKKEIFIYGAEGVNYFLFPLPTVEREEDFDIKIVTLSNEYFLKPLSSVNK